MYTDQNDKIDYIEFINIYKCYIDTFDSIYNLKTNDPQGINNIYFSIKDNLIETQIFSPIQVIQAINTAAKYHLHYLSSYWALIQNIINEYKPKLDEFNSKIFNWLIYKNYGSIFNQTQLNYFKRFSDKNYSLDVHEENTIYRAIMTDNKESFVSFMEIGNFDEKYTFSNEFYPANYQKYSLLELCCYYGAVNCFKFLRTNYNSQITERCLQLSFLSGNPDIMSECLKHQKPNKLCMKYAIISHNIDYVTFLMNECDLEIDLHYCVKYYNLQAFFVYLDHTKDINKCFIYSLYLRIPSLVEYLIDHGANINNKNKEGQTALNISLKNKSLKIAELLVSRGANVDSLNKKRETPLYCALKDNNSLEEIEFLLSHGADINRKFGNDITYLHLAIHYRLEAVKLLIKYGAKINIKDRDGKTPLHYAAQYADKEVLNYLILKGANFYEKDKYSKTALKIALDFHKKENADLLISYGATPFI